MIMMTFGSEDDFCLKHGRAHWSRDPLGWHCTACNPPGAATPAAVGGAQSAAEAGPLPRQPGGAAAVEEASRGGEKSPPAAANAWKVSMEAAAERAEQVPGLSHPSDYGAVIRSLPESPAFRSAFRSAVEAEMRKVVEVSEAAKTLRGLADVYGPFDPAARTYLRGVADDFDRLLYDKTISDQAVTRLRAELAEMERKSDAEINLLRNCLAQAERDLDAAHATIQEKHRG